MPHVAQPLPKSTARWPSSTIGTDLTSEMGTYWQKQQILQWSDEVESVQSRHEQNSTHSSLSASSIANSLSTSSPHVFQPQRSPSPVQSNYADSGYTATRDLQESVDNSDDDVDVNDDLQLDVPHFDIPRLGVPRMDARRVDVSLLNVPRADVSRVGVPRVGVPSLGVPRADVSCLGVPRADVPRLGAPRVDVPRLDVPRVEVPCLPLSRSLRLCLRRSNNNSSLPVGDDRYPVLSTTGTSGSRTSPSSSISEVPRPPSGGACNWRCWPFFKLVVLRISRFDSRWCPSCIGGQRGVPRR